jgi:hypothetical protein
MDHPLTGEEANAAQRRFVRVLVGVIAAYLILVALHHGDFWPFSRFPMFARSAKPWSRALLRELTPAEVNGPWRDVSESELPGKNVNLHPLHKSQDDISTVVGKMRGKIKPEQQRFLAEYFAEARATRHLVLYAARGKLLPGRIVSVHFHPLVLLGPDGVRALDSVAPTPAAAPQTSGSTQGAEGAAP